MLLWIPSRSSHSIHYQTPPQTPSGLSMFLWSLHDSFLQGGIPFPTTLPKLEEVTLSFEISVTSHSAHAVTTGVTCSTLTVFRPPVQALSHHLPTFLAADSFLLIRTPWESHQLSQQQLKNLTFSAEGHHSIPSPLASHEGSIVVSKVEKESWLFNFFLIFSQVEPYLVRPRSLPE